MSRARRGQPKSGADSSGAHRESRQFHFYPLFGAAIGVAGARPSLRSVAKLSDRHAGDQRSASFGTLICPV